MRFAHIAILTAAISLSGCIQGPLHDLQRPSDGPDEFRIVPSKPLQAPDSYTNLPEPTPGGVNLTDQRPLEESVAELGGRRPGDSTAIPGADGGVVNYVSRFGRDPGIRTTLAAEDEDFRRRRGRFTQIRIVRDDRYSRIYGREALNPQRALDVWRRAGARTPTAPPE